MTDKLRELASDMEAMLIAAADRLEANALGVVRLELFGWTITNEDEPWSINQGNKFKAVDDEGTVKAAKTLQELITEIAEEQDDFRNRQEDALSKNIEAKGKEIAELKAKIKERDELLSDTQDLLLQSKEYLVKAGVLDTWRIDKIIARYSNLNPPQP